MAETTIYDLPYPTNTDPVDVAGDIQSLAEAIDAVLPTIGLPFHTLEIRNVSGVSIAKGRILEYVNSSFIKTSEVFNIFFFAN